MLDFNGIIASAITPRSARADVDLSAAFELIDHLGRTGVSGIALFGAAGEYPAAPMEERVRLVHLAVKRSRVPIFAGIGSATLETTVALAREARDAEAAGALAPPPFFYQYDQDEIEEYYRELADQTAWTGILLYDIPAYTSRIEEATAISLLRTGRFAGIASGRDAEELKRIRAAVPERFAVIPASDAELVKARLDGAPAALSDAACAVPELVVALDRALAGESLERARVLEATLNEFLAWVDRFPEPVVLKIATKLRGMKTGALAVPLPEAKRKLLDEFGRWFEQWLPATRQRRA